jgi:hypothetical protein
VIIHKNFIICVTINASGALATVSKSFQSIMSDDFDIDDLLKSPPDLSAKSKHDPSALDFESEIDAIFEEIEREQLQLQTKVTSIKDGINVSRTPDELLQPEVDIVAGKDTVTEATESSVETDIETAPSKQLPREDGPSKKKKTGKGGSSTQAQLKTLRDSPKEPIAPAPPAGDCAKTPPVTGNTPVPVPREKTTTLNKPPPALHNDKIVRSGKKLAAGAGDEKTVMETASKKPPSDDKTTDSVMDKKRKKYLADDVEKAKMRRNSACRFMGLLVLTLLLSSIVAACAVLCITSNDCSDPFVSLDSTGRLISLRLQARKSLTVAEHWSWEQWSKGVEVVEKLGMELLAEHDSDDDHDHDHEEEMARLLPVMASAQQRELEVVGVEEVEVESLDGAVMFDDDDDDGDGGGGGGSMSAVEGVVVGGDAIAVPDSSFGREAPVVEDPSSIHEDAAKEGGSTVDVNGSRRSEDVHDGYELVVGGDRDVPDRERVIAHATVEEHVIGTTEKSSDGVAALGSEDGGGESRHSEHLSVEEEAPATTAAVAVDDLVDPAVQPEVELGGGESWRQAGGSEEEGSVDPDVFIDATAESIVGTATEDFIDNGTLGDNHDDVAPTPQDVEEEEGSRTTMDIIVLVAVFFVVVGVAAYFGTKQQKKEDIKSVASLVAEAGIIDLHTDSYSASSRELINGIESASSRPSGGIQQEDWDEISSTNGDNGDTICSREYRMHASEMARGRVENTAVDAGGSQGSYRMPHGVGIDYERMYLEERRKQDRGGGGARVVLNPAVSMQLSVSVHAME